MDQGVWSMTKRQLKLVCGLSHGTVEIRKTSNLSIIASFTIHSSAVCSVTVLEDGSIVSGSFQDIKRCNERGIVLQTFSGHKNCVETLMQLNNNLLVSASRDATVRTWNISTGECLCTMILHYGCIYGLIKLSEDKFASGSVDKTIRVWNTKGDCIETIKTGNKVTAMTRIRDSIITANKRKLEVWRLK